MKYLFLFVLLTLSVYADAQLKLVAVKADSSKKIDIKANDLVRLRYTGYMHEPQEAEGYVRQITDSTISLAPRRKFLQKKPLPQTVMIHDITGFRRYSKIRPAMEIIYGVLGVGITGGVSAIISNGSSSPALVLVSTAATGAITAMLSNALFGHKIKNQLADGWQLQVQ